jgi:radical SAM/Cys-rich protein
MTQQALAGGDAVDRLPSFSSTLRRQGVERLRRAPLRELQINLGRLCNQACHHCHVDAGPKRTEIMSRETADRVLAWAQRAGITRVDVTGGAPELNPSFRYLMDRMQGLGAALTSRCNLTVLLEPGQDDLAEWYAERRIRLVCSLPCYTRENVDAQRGRGVFGKSIEALQRLNRLGYGTRDDLVLDLVYNPGGAFLPPAQASLEADYRTRLAEEFGIRFTRLLTLTNLPINRFLHFLEKSGRLAEYQRLLVDSFNPATVEGLMCRHLVSVDWQGRVFDCDFNQMIDLPMGGRRRHLWDVDPGVLDGDGIAVGDHCYGCTAGAGSSCGGALA